MQELISLIDKASKVCGNDAALADRMGVKPQVISMLRGGRTITPDRGMSGCALCSSNASLTPFDLFPPSE